MTALKLIGYDPNNWGPMLIHIISTKLDSTTLKEWETQASKKEVPEVAELLTFLQNRFQILEAVEGAQNINLVVMYAQSKLNKGERFQKTIAHTSTNKFKCYCVVWRLTVKHVHCVIASHALSCRAHATH